MTALIPWISVVDTAIWFLLVLFIFWFGAIIYCIPVKQYIDSQALEAERRVTEQRQGSLNGNCDIATQGKVPAFSSM
jgi:hypothetical protein